MSAQFDLCGPLWKDAPMTTSKELLRYQREGAEIVTVYDDAPVVYRPRDVENGDRVPWILASEQGARFDDARFRASELRAVAPNGGGPWAVARLLKLG